MIICRVAGYMYCTQLVGLGGCAVFTRATMLASIHCLSGAPRGRTQCVVPASSRSGASPQMSATTQEAERRERLKQLFGEDFKDDEAKELSRVTKVEQPEAEPEAPAWMVDPRTPINSDEVDSVEQRIKRLTLWLEDGGVDMEKILLVRASVDEEKIVLVAAEDLSLIHI